MKLFGLRFAKAEEIEYRQSLERHFLFPISLGSGAIACVSTWLTLEAWHALKDNGDGVFVVAMVGSRLICAMSAVMLLFICILKSQTMRLQSLSLEFIGVAWVLQQVLSLCWFNSWHGPKLFGKDPHRVFPDWNLEVDSNVLIFLCSLISATCLAAPVRISLSWLVPACGVLSFFSATFIFGSASESGMLLNGSSFIVLVVCSLHGSYQNEGYRRQEFLAQRKVGTQQNQLSKQFHGVCRILSIVCDCLIHIGPDCQILEPSARFAAMLMHTGRQSLEGTSFVDYISGPAEKERFKLMVTGTQTPTSRSDILEATSTTGMFHICLRDVCGQSFPVDIYHTQVIHDASTEYLIGIVERSEPSERQLVPARSELQAVHILSPEPNVIGFMQQHGSQGSSSLGMEVEARDEMTSSDSGSSDLDHALTLNVGLVAVEFSANIHTGCPVISCTPGFASLGGPIMEMQPLSTFIEEPVALFGEISDMVNSFYNGCRSELGGVVFAKPHGLIKYNVDYVSMVIIGCREDSNSQDSYPGSQLVIRAVFHGIHQQRRRRRRHSRRHTSSLQPRASLPSISALTLRADGRNAQVESI